MNDPALAKASLEVTVPRWLWWMNAFCFGFAAVVEFTHLYCLASLIGLFIISVAVGTMLGVIVGLLAYSFERDGVALFPTTLEIGGWRALIAGALLAYALHLFGH